MEFIYFINEALGTVVCRGDHPMEEIHREYEQFATKYEMPYDATYISEFIKKYGQQLKKTVGMARCNYEEGEVFDEDFGKKLALERYMKAFEFFRENFYSGLTAKYYRVSLFTAVRADASFDRRVYERTDKINALIDSLRETSD